MKYPVNVCVKCSLSPMFSYYFVKWSSCYWKYDIKIYYCWLVVHLSILIYYYFMYLGTPVLGTYIFISFVNWFFYHSLRTFFLFSCCYLYRSWTKFYFVWHKCSYPCIFWWLSFAWAISFHLTLYSMWEMRLLKSIHPIYVFG